MNGSALELTKPAMVCPGGFLLAGRVFLVRRVFAGRSWAVALPVSPIARPQPPDMPNPPARGSRRGVMGVEIRRAARGVRRLESVCGVHAAAFAMTCTGWRKPCAARCPPDGVHIRQARLSPCRQPGHGQRLKGGRHSPTRAWPFVAGAGAPALHRSEAMRRQPRTRKTARHRPVSTPRLAAGRRGPAQGPGVSPVAGSGRAPERTA